MTIESSDFDQAREIIGEINRLDAELYTYALDLFAKREQIMRDLIAG